MPERNERPKTDMTDKNPITQKPDNTICCRNSKLNRENFI